MDGMDGIRYVRVVEVPIGVFGGDSAPTPLGVSANAVNELAEFEAVCPSIVIWPGGGDGAYPLRGTRSDDRAITARSFPEYQ
jgi:hypothetical protein